MKNCKKCNETKSLIEFPKESRSKDGHRTICKDCTNLINKKYRDENNESFNSRRRDYYQENLTHLRNQKKSNAIKYKPQKAIYDKKYRSDNKVSIAKYKLNWERNNMTPERKIKRNLRRRVHHALNGLNKSASTFELLGCNIDEFKTYLENQFTEGMSWDNYGNWHIDHIKPCYTFDLNIPQQQLDCFHYSNQRPLWAIDNLSRPRNI